MTEFDLHVPSPAEARGADRALRALGHDADAPLFVRATGAPGAQDVELPAEARALLLRILGHMANGDAVTIVPVAAEVTAQQAAEILGVSRPFVIRLVDEGKLACRLVGTHRRIPLGDVLAFKQANRAERRAIAAELTAEAQELGFGYK
ncbi:MAG: helix-turn-helix domain-containing protein [Pseudomonadota bacterium]|nr:helix-turn-helix domain-containing protein [Pseudomonadota bacterium]